jgi:hypothetical protein
MRKFITYGEKRATFPLLSFNSIPFTEAVVDDRHDFRSSRDPQSPCVVATKFDPAYFAPVLIGPNSF